MNKKEIIKQGVKPALHFICSLCCTEWIDSEYQIKKEVISSFCIRCPYITNKTSDYKISDEDIWRSIW